MRVDLLQGWGTAAEVTDTMLEAVAFTPAGAWQPIPIEDEPPRLFSEAMRDEVVSKVVLLARDDSIKNPSILVQLRG